MANSRREEAWSSKDRPIIGKSSPRRHLPTIHRTGVFCSVCWLAARRKALARR
jgi:hypothetical protein